MPTSEARTAVVTVNYRSEAVLPEFFASLPAASTHPLTVVVADNAASDEARAMTQERGATYLRLPDNRGYGGAINAAVAQLPGAIEYVVISNSDISFAPGSIERLVETADATPDAGAVGQLIRNVDGSVYPSARRVPSLRTGVGHALFANLWLTNPWTRAYRLENEAEPHRRDAGWLSGACVLVRREVFDRLGGFDEGYFMYFEDVDLGYRFGEAGARNIYEPSAEVTHIGGHSTASVSELMLQAHHDSARRFLSKKYSGALMWPIRFGLNIGLSVRARITRCRVRRGA